jgi:hypothetical protein
MIADLFRQETRMGLPHRIRNQRRPDLLEETVGRLYRSKGHDVAELVSPFGADQRARLALFCYNRAHMREIGLAVAATCDLSALVEAGAAVGEAVFALSRERPPPEAKPLVGRRQITLAKLGGNPVPDENADLEPHAADAHG